MIDLNLTCHYAGTGAQSQAELEPTDCDGMSELADTGSASNQDTEQAGPSSDRASTSPGRIRNEQARLETSEGTDVSAKAKNFIAKFRGNLIAEVQAKFADKLTTYEAIQSFNAKKLVAEPIFGHDTVNATKFGTFFSNADAGWRQTKCMPILAQNVM